MSMFLRYSQRGDYLESQFLPAPLLIEDDEDTQKSQLLELVYGNLLPLLVVNSLAGLGVSYILWQAGLDWVWLWFCAMIVLNGSRLIGLQRFYAAPPAIRANPVSRQFWQRMFTFGLLSTASMWAALVWVGINVNQTQVQYVLMVVVSASAGGATGVIAPLKAEGRAYILCLLFPACVRLIYCDHPQPIMAGLGLVFIGVMLISHSKNNRVLRDGLRLRAHNSRLIDRLTERNHAIEDLNANLEAKVSERTEALRQIAHHDHLTGLLNRRGLLEWMTDHLRNEATTACALFLDLDRFKQINDGLGHEAGDHVLQLMAQRLSAALPPWATIGRWGGDEFVVVATLETASQDDCNALAYALIDVLSQPFETHAKSLTLGVSIGTSLFPQDARSPKALVHAADLAAAEVKRTGRGQVIAYEETFGEIQRRHFDLNRALGQAIAGDELKLAYQPIIEAATGDIFAFEVLLRWQHPQLGLISPEVFIPLAEDSDRICEIGDWVLSRACEKAAGWASGRQPGPKVAVNVSMRQLLAEGFAERVALTLLRTGLLPDRLDLEVTESLFDEEGQARSLGSVQALRALGVGVHIDDFGTGFSSLSRLHQFPVTAIKIDKTFVAQLHAQGHIIIESTLMIARRFGLKVIAEGVETLEQAQELSAMGVDYFQGYYFARPQFEPVTNTYAPEWVKAASNDIRQSA